MTHYNKNTSQHLTNFNPKFVNFVIYNFKPINRHIHMIIVLFISFLMDSSISQETKIHANNYSELCLKRRWRTHSLIWITKLMTLSNTLKVPSSLHLLGAALAHCVSSDLKMGAGIAMQVKHMSNPSLIAKNSFNHSNKCLSKPSTNNCLTIHMQKMRRVKKKANVNIVTKHLTQNKVFQYTLERSI